MTWPCGTFRSSVRIFLVNSPCPERSTSTSKSSFCPLFGWSKERRFVVLRERLRETKAAVGRLLIDVPGYTFRVWVTNRSEDALELWRDYNGRACVEQRIEELKHDLAADGFCLHPFFATESAFLAVLFTFNLLSRYQHQTTPDAVVSAAGDVARGGVPVRRGAGRYGPRRGGQTLGGVGRFAQTQTVGGSNVGLAQTPVAEVNSTPGPARHRRRYDLISRARSLENYRSTSGFGFYGQMFTSA